MEHIVKKLILGMALTVALLTALPAAAETVVVAGPGPGPNSGPGPQPPPFPVAPGPEFFVSPRRYYRPIAVMLKMGAADYTGTIGEYTVIGPTWGVALSVHPFSFLGFEVSYDGARNELDTLRFPGLQPAAFWRNGGSALVKVCVPFEALRPFAGVGFGLSYVSVTGADAGMFQSDFMGEFPLVLGVEINSDVFVGGVRFVYHVLVDEGFVKNNAGLARGGFMDVQATLGIRF